MPHMEINVKIMHGPAGFAMSLSYFIATAATVYLEKVLGFLHLSLISCSILTVLMVIDFITGIWKSKRLQIPITSKTAKEGFYEKAVTLIALLTLALVIRLAGIPTAAFINVIMVIGALIEAYSIFGNLVSIRTRKPVTEQDALTFALKTAQHKLWRWIKYLSKKGEPGDDSI